MEYLHYVSLIIALVSMSVLIYGSTLAFFGFLKNEIGRINNHFQQQKIVRIKIELGQYLLLGLEILIASDIIETIVKPGLEEIAQVGGVVLIRTILSFFLNKEIENQDRVLKMKE